MAATSTSTHPSAPKPANSAPGSEKSARDRLIETIASTQARLEARLKSSPSSCHPRRDNFPRIRSVSQSTRLKSPGRPDLSRHRRKCLICGHPDREAIEELFLHWHNPEWLSCLFDLPNCAPIYRHAHATGLYARRRANLRMSLEHLIEQADGVDCNGAVIVRAVRAYACLTDSGEWVEPVKRVEFSSASSSCASPAPGSNGHKPRPAGRADIEHESQTAVHELTEESAHHAASPQSKSPLSNRNEKLLESAVSHSRQTAGVVSNRKKIALVNGNRGVAEISKCEGQYDSEKIL